MNEIGAQLKTAREKAGVSLEEASEDLKIKALAIENIEEGNIGCFKDIFELKNYIKDYAKYLGFDPVKLIDDFNSYMFEYTSKIPVKDIEKKVKEKERQEKKEAKIASPYTMPLTKLKKNYMIYVYALLGIIAILLVIFAVKEMTINRQITNEISYFERG